MKPHLNPLSATFLSAILLVCGRSAAGATIRDVSVAEGEDSIRLRLALDSEDRGIKPKVICAPDAIRVRIPGLATVKPGLDELDLPASGPLLRARIVPSERFGTVVQMVSRGSNMAACGKTLALNLGNEIVIATEYSAEDLAHRARLERLLSDGDAPGANTGGRDGGDVGAREPSAAAGGDGTASDISGADTPAPEAAAAANGFAPTGGAAGLFDRSSKDAPNAPAADESPRERDMAWLRYAGALAFAALVGFVAWRLKKRNLAGGRLHDIDILSSRRIGPKQQLMLVSVEGSHVLLAVTDRNITTLNLPTPRPEVQTMPGDREERAPKRGELIDRDPPDDAEFEGSFRRALRSMRGQATAHDEDTPSNIEGLLALARRRSETERNMRRSDIPEA